MLRRFLLVMLILAVLPLAARAQAPLTESYTSINGVLTVHYPAGWLVTESGGQVLLANNPEAFRARTAQLGSGQMQFLITPVSRADLGLGESPELVAVIDLFLDFIESSLDAPFSEPESVVVGSRQAALSRNTEGNFAGVVLAVRVAEGSAYIYIVGVGAVGENTLMEESARAIAAGLSYGNDVGVGISEAVPEVPSQGQVVWQLQRAVGSTPDNFPPFGDLALGADERLFAAAGTLGIFEFNTAGELVAVLADGETATADNVTDLAPTAQDTFWIADQITRQIQHIDAQGVVLAQYGDESIFGDTSPTQIELGADDHLYVFNTTVDARRQNLGEIQVWNQAGDFLRAFPTRREDETGFDFFVKLTLGADGNLYLVDPLSGVRVMNTQGDIVVENLGGAALAGAEPTAIATAPNGELFVATRHRGIFHLDSTGQLIARFGAPQAPPQDSQAYGAFEPGQFFNPSGIVVLGDGDVVVVDTNFNFAQVVRIRFGD